MPEDLEDDDNGGPSAPEPDESVEFRRFLLDEHPTDALPVFASIHRVKQLLLVAIDDPYTKEQLTGPRISTLVIRPLVDKLYDPQDYSIVYCLLANRVQFLRGQSTVVHHSLSVARADLCELVASRILRRFHEDNPGTPGLVTLARILVDGFDPFQGADDAVQRSGRRQQWPVQARGGHERKLTALELAILSESKSFIASAACQTVVEAVYQGQITYTPLSFVDILPDHYKHHPAALYDPRRSPILNHYRLIVPRSRNVIEASQYILLVTLYALAMVHRRSDTLSAYEISFAVYTAGWILNEFAAIIEHGWEVHAQNLWSFLDLAFIIVFAAYVLARIHDLMTGVIADGIALHILCVGAPILLTRIAFNLMPDNIVFISLHAMMKDFMLVTMLAVWCFAGFFVALMWLVTSDRSASPPTWYNLSKWLLWIWFGLDGTGIEESVRFHVVLGPSLMIAFAFLGNTLFLTVLVAMLTNTFSRVVAEEAAEIRFRRTVLTFQGVKSDAIFAYPPPFNILALVVLLPLKFVLGPRTFHSTHVYLARILNAPTLLLITLYERHQMWAKDDCSRGLRSRLVWHFTGFSPHGDIQAVFEADPPAEVVQSASEFDRLSEMGFAEDDVLSRASRETRRPIVFKLGLGNRDTTPDLAYD